jgi:AcrR family transcriptional regulator
MRLPSSDRKKQLLEIAMKLFSEQGFDGTSTREIAQAAGVNEALIFRHFRTKEDLFWAVLSDRVERRGRNRRMRELVQSHGNFREVLVAIAETLLDRTEDDAAVTRLLFYSALRNRELSNRFFQTYGQEKFEMLATLLRAGTGGGDFRKVNPVIAARAFLGMIVYDYLVEEVFGVPHAQPLSKRELAVQLVDIFLRGISANGIINNNGAGRKTARTSSRKAVAVGS